MQNSRRGRTLRLSSFLSVSFPRSRTPSRNYNSERNRRGMPLHLWGVDRRDVWRTCICLHVRTVTIFIGVWYLMLYILALSFMAALLMYEPNGVNVIGDTRNDEQILPTPLSKSAEQESFSALTNNYRTKPNDEEEEYSPKSKIDQIRNGPWNLVLDTKKANSQVVLLTVCNMMITLLMVYGAVRGKPSYLMPFFILKVFEFCIFCLSMVGFFSSLPNVTELVSRETGLPYQKQLLQLDPQLLSLLTLLAIIGAIALKAYVISVIWNCYKYLMLRNTVIRGVIAYRNPDDPINIIGIQQNLLPDLPDYDTAINDPRYAKKPPTEGVSTTGSTTTANMMSVTASAIALAPPPYSEAIGTEPLTIPNQPPQPNQESSNVTATTAGNEFEVAPVPIGEDDSIATSPNAARASQNL